MVDEASCFALSGQVCVKAASFQLASFLFSFFNFVLILTTNVIVQSALVQASCTLYPGWSFVHAAVIRVLRQRALSSTATDGGFHQRVAAVRCATYSIV